VIYGARQPAPTGSMSTARPGLFAEERGGPDRSGPPERCGGLGQRMANAFPAPGPNSLWPIWWYGSL
jgi:hypothetical protein